MTRTPHTPSTRIVAGGLILAVSYWISPMLFWIVTGVYAAVVFTRSKQSTLEEEVSEPVNPYELLIAVREDAILRDDSVLLSEGPWLIQLRERSESVTGGHPQLEAICPICPPIPFCFILRPHRPLEERGKLVINTPVEASFEYELKAFELEEELSRRFDCATNASNLFKQCLNQGFNELLQDATRHHSIHLQEVIFDGSRVRVTVLPAQPVSISTREAEQLTAETRLLADNLREFITANELVEAVRRKS